MNINTPLLAITGPTASGKTARAVDVALRLSGEIVSADSRQIYRGMTIGSGKDLGEYGEVPYHLIDIAPAGYKYNLFEYVRDCRDAIDSIVKRNHLPVLCGGTGMYLEAILKGLSLPAVPENPQLRAELASLKLPQLKEMLASMKSLHNDTDVDTEKRAIRAIEIQKYYAEHPDEAVLTEPHPLENAVIVGVDIDRETRRSRIEARLRARLDEGMVDEVRTLLDSGIAPEDLEYYGLEYKYITKYVTGRMSAKQMFDELLIAIHQFAKRQMTWFRGMERRGFTIHWLPATLSREEFTDRVAELAETIKR